MKGSARFWIGAILFLVVVVSATQTITNEYPFFAGYVILQFVVLAMEK
jgi:branched-chain amino acid transport system permease protein